VHTNEHHLKTADEVARHQQLKAAVAKRLAQGLPDALVALRCLPPPANPGSRRPMANGKMANNQGGKQHQGLLPAQVANQARRGGHHQAN
jgi:hypothetical protein